MDGVPADDAQNGSEPIEREKNARTSCADGIVRVARRAPYLRQSRHNRNAAARQPAGLSADRIHHGPARGRRCQRRQLLCAGDGPRHRRQPACRSRARQRHRLALRRAQGQFARRRDRRSAGHANAAHESAARPRPRRHGSAGDEVERADRACRRDRTDHAPRVQGGNRRADRARCSSRCRST